MHAMNDGDTGHFTQPTTDFWQEILPADHQAGQAAAPFRHGYPARLPDGRILMLPLRALPDGERAVASLIANQAAFDVIDALSAHMAEAARTLNGTVVIGVPTLGLAFAPLVARRLGQGRYLPLGYSRKYWYREALSERVRSVTTPGQDKRVHIDPNLLALLRGQRAILVDDAVSSGSTLAAVLALLARLDCDIAGIVVAMRQGTAWRARLGEIDPALPGRVRGVLAAPIFRRVAEGWDTVAGTLDIGPPDDHMPI